MATVRIRSSSVTILLITLRIRSRAALGGERQPGAAAVAGELVGQRDVERVDPGRRQRQRDVGALVAVGQALGDLADLGVVGARQRQQADLLEAGLADAVLDHVADGRDRALAHRAGDHAGLAEAAAAGAAAEDLDGEPLVHGLGERHQRLARGRATRRGPSACACAPATGRPGRFGATRWMRPSAAYVDVVELRDVDAAGDREPAQQLVAPARARPRPSTRGRPRRSRARPPRRRRARRRR